MRRLAEGPPELTAEMRAREAGRTSQIGDTERLRVARVDQIPGPQQVTLSRHNTHRRESLPVRRLRLHVR
jgi:hypothetical protein